MKGVEPEPEPVTIRLEGQELELLPEKAIYWRRKETLLIADLHLGKAAAFRSHNVPVPSGTTEETLARLSSCLDFRAIRRLIVLGDLLHAKAGLTPTLIDALARWRDIHDRLDITLVLGNHDRLCGTIPASLRIDCCEDSLTSPPFCLQHDPAALCGDDRYRIAGHLHPAARLTGLGKQTRQFPCFWFRRNVAVLPAFGEFTGSSIVQAAPSDRVFVIVEKRVIKV